MKVRFHERATGESYLAEVSQVPGPPEYVELHEIIFRILNFMWTPDRAKHGDEHGYCNILRATDFYGRTVR
jgi:hypothetical protein